MVERPAQAVPTEPATLGRFRIQRELGRGAMGRVFLAHDPQIDRRVALKTIQFFEALAEHERFASRERFLREARAVGRLSHPGIVTLYDVDEIEGVLFLVLEYVEGVTLDAFCHPDHRLAPEVAVEIVARAAEALGYAHRAGIVHRDVKPQNMIRVGEREIKLTDFGLAKPPETQLTQDGALLGTPSYMSPEQIRGECVDGRSDLFSLGGVLFELLSGERAFAGDTVSSILYRIVHEPARELGEMLPATPPALQAFLREALAKDAAARPQTGEEFAAGLRQAARLAGSRPAPRIPDSAAAEPTVPVAPADPVARLPARPPSSIAPFVLGALAIAGVAAAAFWWSHHETASPGAAVAPGGAAWEARVRTTPPGLEVRLEGQPLATPGSVRFGPATPFGTLSVDSGCRRVEYALAPADAGTEIVLAVEPTEITAPLATTPAGAAVRVDGIALGRSPLDLALDLCRAHRIEIDAAGYRTAAVDLPAGAAPLEARNLLTGVALAPIPQGTLVLPAAGVELVYYIDGAKVDGSSRRVELTEGRHVLRATNAYHWIELTREIDVAGGATVEPALDVPPLGQLVVQVFPPASRIWLRRPGESFRLLEDEAPATRRVAAGRYEVKVEQLASGETRLREIDVQPGNNPPLRVTFAVD